MQIQSNLGSDIAMAFDECIENPSPREYVQASVERTTRWLERCITEHARLNAQPDMRQSRPDALWHQSGRDLCRYPGNSTWSALPNWTVTASPSAGWRLENLLKEMYDIIDAVEPSMPKDKPRYLMGVGTPLQHHRAVSPVGWTSSTVLCPPATPATASFILGRGPSTSKTKNPHRLDPIGPDCDCRCAAGYSRAYLRHLLAAGEMLAMRPGVLHNLHFYNELMARIRQSLDEGTFESFRQEYSEKLARRI